MTAPRLIDVTAADGRILRVLDVGRIGDPVLVAHHGTPGAGRLSPSELASAERAGLRLITFDRPGYAGSSPRPGRSVVDAAGDVEAILGALEVEQFATYGAAGGGPHALACAARLGGRCGAVATLAGFAPSDAPDLDWADGMSDGNLAELAAAARGREILIDFCRVAAAEIAVARSEGLAEAMEPHLSAVDLSVLRGDHAEFLVEEAIESVAHGVEGWADDDLAYLRPWGFDVAAISQPALIWHGSQDRLVPTAHAHWLGRHVTGAKLWLSPDEGHLSLGANRIGEVHAWLAGHLAAGPA